MWDANADALLTQFRASAAATAAWIAAVNSAGQEAAHIHFPSYLPGGPNGEGLPGLLLSVRYRVRRWAEGSGGLRGGVLTVIAYFPASGNGGTAQSAAQVEAWAQAFVGQLLSAQPLIIPFTGEQDIGEASDPAPAARAADDTGQPASFRTITIRLPFGYSS